MKSFKLKKPIVFLLILGLAATALWAGGGKEVGGDGLAYNGDIE